MTQVRGSALQEHLTGCKLLYQWLKWFSGGSRIQVAGEAGDIAWAPIEAYLLMTMFGSNAIAGLGFIEEALPGFDIIPTATIAWLIENTESLSGVKRALFPKDRL